MDSKRSVDISIVIPVYGSKNILPELHERIDAVMQRLQVTFELIFVNDASPDGAWEVIRELAAKDSRVRGINLSRNFGQYPAMTAGLRASRGEWIVVMDCDLQDQPEEIEHMYRKAHEGYDVVVGSRQERHDSFFRLLVSKFFYSTLTYLSGTFQDRTAANFGLYRRCVIEAVLSLPEHMRYFSVMVRWVGFRTTSIPVKHGTRKGGRSGYSIRKLTSLAIDIILAYTEKPLRFIIKFGAVVALVAGVYLLIVLASSFITNTDQLLQIIIGTLWFTFGLLSTMLGVIALYLGKTFDECKRRPVYIIMEEI